jgi:hypothetical protein
VRAALSIQRALAESNRRNEGASRPELAARIAIDTGPAVLDAGGEIFGDVPNIAARSRALAEPGTVVATGRVQRQAVGLLVVEECGSHELKGVNSRAHSGKRPEHRRIDGFCVDASRTQGSSCAIRNRRRRRWLWPAVFADQSHFTRAFTKLSGTSPGAWQCIHHE